MPEASILVVTGFQTGSGQVGTEGSQIPYMLPYVGFSAHMLPHVVILCHISIISS